MIGALVVLIAGLVVLLGVAVLAGGWMVRHGLRWLYLVVLFLVAGLWVLGVMMPEWFIPARPSGEHDNYLGPALAVAINMLSLSVGFIGLLIGGASARRSRDD